jgi:hypothetical protein
MTALVQRKLWRRSPVYQAKRRIVFLGAFKKWRAQNPDECKRIEERFKRENGQPA